MTDPTPAQQAAWDAYADARDEALARRNPIVSREVENEVGQHVENLCAAIWMDWRRRSCPAG